MHIRQLAGLMGRGGEAVLLVYDIHREKCKNGSLEFYEFVR